MPILRHNVNEYERTTKKRIRPQKRKPEDWDLAWSDFRVYVIDKHEWFDPHTSTKYSSDGISRHAMFGPAAIITETTANGESAFSTDVNDPSTWAWIRRVIKQSQLTSDTMVSGIDNEADIEIKE